MRRPFADASRFAGAVELAITLVDLDRPPAIFDRYLSHQCLELLMRNKPVYDFVMGKYAESSEIWQRLREQGYGR